jgi:ankyrin repeat protein
VYYVGNTALIRAAKGGHTDIARLLVEHKADMDIKDNNGTQPEIESALHDHTCWMLHK